MLKVKFNNEKVKELRSYLDDTYGARLEESANEFKALWGWSARNEESSWDVGQRNIQAMYHLVTDIVECIQMGSDDIQGITNQDKHETAARWVDEFVKFEGPVGIILELLDRKIIDVAIIFVVKSIK